MLPLGRPERVVVVPRDKGGTRLREDHARVRLLTLCGSEDTRLQQQAISTLPPGMDRLDRPVPDLYVFVTVF